MTKPLLVGCWRPGLIVFMIQNTQNRDTQAGEIAVALDPPPSACCRAISRRRMALSVQSRVNIIAPVDLASRGPDGRLTYVGRVG